MVLVKTIFRENMCGQEMLHHCKVKLMKGKALRKHSLHEQTAASVLLKYHFHGPLGSCIVFLLTIEFDHALGASVMWHLSFALMNSFNNTEAAIFHVQSELKVLSSKRFSERKYEARQCYIIVNINWRDV